MSFGIKNRYSYSNIHVSKYQDLKGNNLTNHMAMQRLEEMIPRKPNKIS